MAAPFFLCFALQSAFYNYCHGCKMHALQQKRLKKNKKK